MPGKEGGVPILVSVREAVPILFSVGEQVTEPYYL